jgi:transcriptional regulator with XRE-family HTH domain
LTEDWAAVATAINQRMTELGLQQRELIERSRLSKAVVHEIRHNARQRRRSARTLEALAVALAWHPDHLVAVLNGREPPQIEDPAAKSDHDVPAHLAAIDHSLREITTRLDGIEAIKNQLNQITTDLSVAMRRNGQSNT